MTLVEARLPVTPFLRWIWRFIKDESDEAVAAYADQILKRVGEPEGRYKLPVLGEGMDAKVFWLSDKKKVLKLTNNYEDAEASVLVQRKPSLHLLKVYDVFEVEKNRLYGIVAEKLTPLSGAEHKEWEDIARIITESGDIYGLPYDWDGLTLAWMRAAEAALPGMTEIAGAAFVQTFKAVLFQLHKWQTDLEARHIIWRDFHPGNIMHRGRHLVISDFGRSYVSGSAHIPPL